MKILHARLIRATALLAIGACGLVAQQNPTITTVTVPNGEVGLRYVYPDNQGFQFTATGGNVNSWQAVPNNTALPPGLDVFSDGSFGSADGSGPEQPTVAGDYTFTVRVSCDCSTSDQKTFTMHVYAPLAIAGPAAIPSATVGQPYQHAFVGQGGDPTAYQWSVFDEDGPFCGTSGVPPGMCLSQAGVLSGIPTTSGDYSFDLSLFNPINTAIGNTSGNDVQLQITIHVNAAAPPQSTGLTLSGPLSLGTFILGTPVLAALTASGGNQPYRFQVTALPAGMTGDGPDISGTPTSPGNYRVGISVTDSASVTANSSVGFSVFGIVPVALPNAVTSSSYSYIFNADGGTPPYVFSATGLPPHFSFSNGSLNGTPAAAGTYTIAVTVTDENGHTYSGSYPLAVTLPPLLKVPGGALPDITVLTPNSQNLSATGGAPGYTWSLAGGSLPDGIGLRPSGTLFGTPSKTGSYTFSARASDVTGASGVGSFSVNVTPTPVIVTTPSPLAAGMVNVDYPLQVLTATGGIGPYTFSVPANSLPAGLTLTPEGAISGTPATVGTSSITVTATDSQKQAGTASLQIRVRPFSPDLTLSAGSLAFSLAAGATVLPGGQSVQVQASDVTKILNYSTAVTSPSGPAANWLSVSPGGKTPGSLTVSLTAAALSLAASATPYQATITVTCLSPSPCAGSAQTVAVLLTLANIPPQLTVLTDLLSFTASSSNPQGASQTILVQNTGGGGIGFSSVTCAAVWCRVGGVPGSIGAGVIGTITIAVDPTGLGGGYYYTVVTILTSAGITIVPVTYFLAPNASLGLSPAGVQLTMTVGGAAAVPDPTFVVNTVGPDSIAWSAAVLPGAPWLQLVSSSTGTATGAAPGSITYAIDQAAAAALAAGTYYGTIRVTSPGAANSPQDFQVVLNVTTVDKQKPNPSPAGLIFITSATPALPPQTVQIFASSVGPVVYQASVQTGDGGNWLSVTPTNGIASASAPGQASISVSPAGLQAGIYHGSVSYSFTASAVRTVNVTLIVQTAVSASAHGSTNGLTSHADLAPCTPTQLIPTQTGLVNNFAAPASWPTPLEIQLRSDCGLGVANGQVVATFSNGDPPLLLALSDTPTGTYSGTWTPRKAGPQVTIIARATAPGLAAAATQITGSVVPNVAPVLTHNGTLHIFNPQVGAPLAPGTIVQIYGSSLANQTLPGTTVPLATSLGGTSVIVGGIQAPLFFVSPGQVNAEIPFELTPGQPYQVVVNNNGALSTPDSIQSAVVAPGVAALPTGFANGQHVADGAVITDASPAKPGEYVVIYLAGLGPTTVPVASGAGAPTSPLAQTQNTPAVTLNAAPVTVLFSGLTPGLAGLYQIDLQVPADAPDGDLPLVVNQPGVAGTSVILPVHK